MGKEQKETRRQMRKNYALERYEKNKKMHKFENLIKNALPITVEGEERKSDPKKKKDKKKEKAA